MLLMKMRQRGPHMLLIRMRQRGPFMLLMREEGEAERATHAAAAAAAEKYPKALKP